MRWRRWMAVEDGCEWLPLIRVSREAPWCGATYSRTASESRPRQRVRIYRLLVIRRFRGLSMVYGGWG